MLFLLSGLYDPQEMGNMIELSIMSLELLPVISVGCIRFNSAACTMILAPSKLYVHGALFRCFDHFSKG